LVLPGRRTCQGHPPRPLPRAFVGKRAPFSATTGRLLRTSRKSAEWPADLTRVPMRRGRARPRASRRRDPSTALGKPSVSAAADDRFAQFDVVGRTITLATERSSDRARTASPGPIGAVTAPKLSACPPLPEHSSACAAVRAKALVPGPMDSRAPGLHRVGTAVAGCQPWRRCSGCGGIDSRKSGCQHGPESLLEGGTRQRTDDPVDLPPITDHDQ
jgi:hypothetical protein